MGRRCALRVACADGSDEDELGHAALLFALPGGGLDERNVTLAAERATRTHVVIATKGSSHRGIAPERLGSDGLAFGPPGHHTRAITADRSHHGEVSKSKSKR